MPSPRIFSFFVLIFTITFIHSSHSSGNDGIVCPDIEKQALLSFKQSVKDSNDTLLSSWKAHVDCCMWEHVVCDNLTSHVLELHLQGHNMSFVKSYYNLDPSLLNLTQLRYLDLSMNFFQSTIPPFFGSFANLEYLNLSFAGFQGAIPDIIGNLSSLRTLALKGNLYVDSLEWLTGLSHLEHLDMTVDLARAMNWPQVINSLPALLELNFRGCDLNSIAPLNEVNFSSLTILDLSANNLQLAPTWIYQLKKLTYLDLSWNNIDGIFPSIVNFTNLRYIDTSRNSFKSTIPNWLYGCKYLEHINMAQNFLQGSISSAIGNLSFLSFLNLGSNELSGQIPSEVGNLSFLSFLDLGSNELSGQIPSAIGNLSFLSFLDLDSNELSGQIPSEVGNLSFLSFLYLSSNELSGQIPSEVGKLLVLESLILDDNKFIGTLPESIGQILNLKVYDVSYNMLEGVVTESHFANLTKLDQLYASGNNLTLKVSTNWVPPFNVTYLALGSCNLGSDGQIPAWIHTQKYSISDLDLSNTGIMHQVPSWCWEINTLNLANNQLRGPLPQVGNSVNSLFLSNNSFTGGLSRLLCDTTSETNRLGILDLGDNMVSGELPDCLMNWPYLALLNLENNSISGPIPESIGFLEYLESLNLSNNTLSGQIPSSLQNCTSLIKIDVGDNQLTGNLPVWMGIRLAYLRILILRSNKLSGKVPSNICHLQSLQILDLSDNLFSGIIPRCVGNFTAMISRKGRLPKLYGSDVWYVLSYAAVSENSSITRVIESASISTKGSKFQYDKILAQVTNIDLSRNNLSGDIPEQLTSLVELLSLNLSSNQLTGLIPNGIGKMKLLESLDLSRNFLSGEIPNTMADLTFLNYLNLSYNNLTGRIPQSTQIMSLPASAFIGNELCGLPLTSNCTNDGGNTTGHEKDSEVSKSEVEWIYVFSGLGYALGLSVVCNVLIFKKSWRYAFFGSVDNIWNKLCVYTSIKLRTRS